MKRLHVIALAVMAGALFNGADAAAKKKKEKAVKQAETSVVELKTAADTLSYAAGMVRTDGLVPYLKQAYGVDTAYMADFIRGYKDALARGFGEKDKAYYAGEQIAQMVSTRMLPFLKTEFSAREDTVSDATFNSGFIAALTGDSTVLAYTVAKDYFDKAFKQAVDDRNAENKKAGEEFLAANKQKEGVVTLPSGLQYKELVKGTGEVATANDEVIVKYEGRLIDGTVFDSSYERPGGTSKFRASQVIKGWTEALTMMPVGSKWELYIPSELAYGERRAGKIEPNSTLIFTVELVGINRNAVSSNKAQKGKVIPSRIKKPAAGVTNVKAKGGIIKAGK